MTWTFVIIGAFYFSTRLFPQTEMVFARIFPRGIGGSLLWVWLVAVAMSQAWINRELGRNKRLALTILTGFLLYVGVIQSYDWKSGWIPQLTAVWIIIFLRYPRLALLLALGGLIFLKDLPSEIIASDEYSYSTRIVAWEIIWKELIRVNPLLGLGPANYYYYTPLFPIMGYNVQFNSHNNYLDIVAQVGILGLAAFLWFVVEINALGLRLRKKYDQTFGFTHAYVIGTLAGLGGSLVAGVLGDWFIPFVYNIGVRGFRSSVIAFLFLGGLVVIERISADQAPQQSEG
jgi:O-antigen ligase